MTNIWQKIKKNAVASSRPIFVMAPMADVTDPAFRQIIAKYSRMGQGDTKEKKGSVLDALWTEFVSADGLASTAGRPILMRDLAYVEAERPIIAQIFTSRPENMRIAAGIASDMGFDGIDINMGCPDKSIEKQGAGAAMIKNIKTAREVIRSAKEGSVITDTSHKYYEKCKNGLPISVKTRIGYNQPDMGEDGWIANLLKEDIAVLTVHARTRKEMSLVPAQWSFVKQAVELRNKIQAEKEVGSRTLIIGNGDVTSINMGRKLCLETGADGVMVGRGIFGNPWFFDEDVELKTTELNAQATEKNLPKVFSVPIDEKLRVMVEHTKLYEKLLGDTKSFAIMKKHYKAYVNGWDGAKELRIKLMETENAGQVEEIVMGYLG